MKIINKIICILILAILISSNILHAAVVSDNDGSAFITKAEFDSLKNNFQSQIDQYNTSIDSKIDSAISGYLSGITYDREVTKNNVCYDENGILAPRGNYADLAWQEGNLEFTSKWIYSQGNISYDRPCGAQECIWKTFPATEFYELAIQNVNYTNGNGRWVGKIKSKQYVTGNSIDAVWNRTDAEMASGVPRYASIYNGLFSISNQDLSLNTSRICHFQYSPFDTGIDYGVFNNANFCHFTRTIISTSDTNIVCVPQSVACSRFSNIEEIRDWCNDTDTAGHTLLIGSAFNTYFDESASKGVKYRFETAGKRQGTRYEWNFDFHTNTRSNLDDNDIRRAKPYFGFVQPITNYNQLWTSNYDNYVGQIISADSDASIFTDSKGVKHLYLYNGAPIVGVSENSKLTMDLEFSDKTKNYDVWFKYGTFNKIDPNNDTDLVDVDDIYYGTTTNTKATVGSLNKAIKVPNGKQTVTIDLKNDSFLFIKWSLSGNSGAGGGKFLPPSTVKIITSNN